MMHSLREMMQTLRASPVFALAVLVTLGLAGFNASMVGLMALRLDFLLPGPFAQMGHFTDPGHRTHDLTFGFLFVPAVVGMLAQLRRPSKNVAGQLMALIPWVGLVLTVVLTFVLTNNTRVLGPQWVGVAAATLIATILHPTWRDFFCSFSVSRVNWVMLALVIIAAVPLLVFASTNIGLQGTVPDEHALMGHYGFMAAFGFTIVGVGLLASLRPDGWWLPAWFAGLLPALLGLASLVYPDASSSLGLVWALAAIAWGIGFVAAAELTQDAERPTPLGSWGIIPTLRGSRGVVSIDDTGVRPTEDRPPGTPRWVNVFGGIALVVLLLLVGNVILTMVTGGGPGGPPGGPGLHGPGQAGSGQYGPSGSDAEAAENRSGADPSPGCRAEPYENPGGSGARVTCEDAHGAGRITQEFTCRAPDEEGGFEVGWDLDAGEVTVTVRDAAGTAVFSDTYSGHGNPVRTDFSQGQAGSWEVEAERGDGFAGSFTVKTFCAWGSG